MHIIQSWLLDEKCTCFIEYALLASLIAMVIVVSVNAVGLQVCQQYKTLAEALSGAMGSSVAVTCS